MFLAMIDAVRNSDLVFDVVGVAGFIFYMSSYALLQFGRISGTGSCYVIMNMLAATLVLISLLHEFNLASLLIQLAWIVISLIGLIRIWRQKESHRDSADLTVSSKRF